MSRLRKIWGDKDKRRGLIATFIIHLFILVALFFLALRTPLPLPGEEGVEVNLGYDEEGYGEIQSETTPPQADPEPTPPPMPQTQEIIEPEPEIIEEEIITQDVEEAPSIEEEKIEEEPEKIIEEPKEIEEKKEEEIIEEIKEDPREPPVDSTYVEEIEEIVEEPVEEVKMVNQRALYKGSSKASEDGTNQGIKPGTGDMGKPEGADIDKYDGQGGQGNGVSFSLGGRGGKFLETPKNVFDESGTVVVRIEVDRSGNVVNTTFLQKGSDVGMLDEKVKLAINAAKNSKFTEKQDAPDRQVGTITYKFIK